MSELFFAIAANHKSTGISEYNKLKKLISEEWQKLDPSQYPLRNYAMEKIKLAFDWFDYENLDPAECFDNFVEYKNDNEDLYTKERKKIIWHTAKILTKFFNDENNMDNKLLNRLKVELF